MTRSNNKIAKNVTKFNMITKNVKIIPKFYKNKMKN